jgi:hypothetical protein
MNRCSIVSGVILLAASLGLGANFCGAQVPAAEQTATTPAGQPASAAQSNQVPVLSGDPASVTKGTTLVAEFSHGLNAKKLKPGDKVKAVLTQDLVLKGKIVAPNESKLVGHVTEVKASTDADQESRLGLVFDKVLLKHHHELNVQAGVQALLAPAIRRSRVDEPDQMMPPPVVASVSNSNTTGRGGTGASRSSNSGPTTSSVASLNSIGAIPTVQSTPGSSPGNHVTRVDLSQATGRRLNASNGMRGVYGIKGISLSPPSNGAAVIISKTSNVKLENGTQLILVVLQ